MLKLSFVQGPRDGESFEYKPGSTIRIGRYVRGNEISVKDGGISTKHLRIDSDSNNWFIHDLGSSNGTIINTDTLDPYSPVILRHGDTIKLGENTSIVVNFVTVDDDIQVEEQEQEHKLPPRPRRNNRRLPDPEPTRDDHELPKRTRASKSKTTVDEPLVKSRVTRSRKKGETVSNPNENQNETTNKNPVKLEIEDTPNQVKKRESRKKQNDLEVEEIVKMEDSVVEEKGSKRPSRSTRSKKNEIGGDPLLELDIVLKQARKSRANNKQQTRNDSEEDDGTKREDQVETRSVEGVENTKTMTVDEWFDLLEVQFPKQIIEETDKMIESMRSKSRRVHEYIQEQKKQAQRQGCV